MMLIDERLTEKIMELIQPLFKEWHYELVEFKLRRQGQTLYVSVIADRPTGGITMGEVALLNRNIGQLIEEAGLIEERYVVEASSPGLDRPLSTANDFARVIGREVKFYLRVPLENRLEYLGIVREALDNCVIIDYGAHTLEISYDNINKALQNI